MMKKVQEVLSALGKLFSGKNIIVTEKISQNE
jgi:hypothetical protein